MVEGRCTSNDGVQTDQELTQLTGDLLYELGAWLWAIGLPRPSPHVAFGIGGGTMCVNHCTWASMFCFHGFCAAAVWHVQSYMLHML